MKKVMTIILVLSLLLSMVACGEVTDPSTKPQDPHAGTTAPTTDDPTDPTQTPAPTDATTPEETEPEETEPIIYEPNLPDDAILAINDKETSVIGKTPKEIFEALDVTYERFSIHNDDDYPNGAPYDLLYKGADNVGWDIVTLSTKLWSDRSTVYFNYVEVHFTSDCEGVSLLGLTENSTEEDLLKMFGTPDYFQRETNAAGTGWYSWYDVQIGDYVFREVGARTTTQKGQHILTEVQLYFQKPTE